MAKDPLHGDSAFAIEGITQTRPRRFVGKGKPHISPATEEAEEESQKGEVFADGSGGSSHSRDTSTWRHAVDTLLGVSPQTIWRVLNLCLPALLLVSALFTYFAWNDRLVRYMFLGFVFLTIAFWALLNWVLAQVLPPKDDD